MKDKTTAALLALFLGGLGLHKFYLEKGVTGILYLVFCWTFIPMILSFFECLGLFMMSQEKFDKLYNKNYYEPMKANMPSELQKLYELKENGIITEEEYSLQKNRLLK